MPQSVESLTLRVEQLERLLAYKPTPDKPKPYQYDKTLVADISTFLSDVLEPCEHHAIPLKELFKTYIDTSPIGYGVAIPIRPIAFGKVVASLYRPHYKQKRINGANTRCLVGYKMR
jgi:hypothetical protein